MNRWFRFYDDAINDPKILKLSDKQHRVWVGLLCIASKNNGQLPSLDDLSLMIRMKPEKLFEVIESLIISGLIDQNEMILSPHNWDKRQYKSDSSTERVKRFRNVTSTVSETGPETEQIQTTEKKVIRTVAKATRPAFGDDFEEFWKVYPKRHGANPKHAAAKLFSQAVKGGADPRAIIEGARRCAIADAGKVGTEFIPQAVKWLRDKRWEDYSVPIEAEIISIAGQVLSA